MATPYAAYTASAGQRDFDVTFPYINRSHVIVRVNGTQVTPLSWLSDTRLRLPSGRAGGDFVEIERSTPIETQLVKFQDGNILTSEDLNIAVQQLLYRQQEVSALYERTLARAQTRLAEANGIPTDTENVVNELAQLVLQDQVFNDLNAKLVGTDLNAESIMRSALYSEGVDAVVRVEQRIREDADSSLAQQITTVAAQYDTAIAGVVSQQTALAADQLALAADLTTVTTTVDANTASVTALSTSVSGLQARYGVSLDVNGYITGFVQNNDGTTGDFTIVADRFAVVDPSDPLNSVVPFEVTGGVVKIKEAAIGNLSVDNLTNGTLTASVTQDADWNVGTGKIVFDNGTYMKVSGVGFGTSNQFIEWFGPKMDVTACSEANAIQYLKTNGDAYFGGSLSAGVLKNAATSTSTAADASLTVGPFGSNGNTITVVTSYAVQSGYTDTYADDATGRSQWESAVTAWGATATGTGEREVNDSKSGTCTVTIPITKNGAAFATLSLTSYTETLVGRNPLPTEGQPYLTYTRTVSGSLTSTDNAGGTTDRTFVATITERTGATIGTIEFQTLSIVATEE